MVSLMLPVIIIQYAPVELGVVILVDLVYINCVHNMVHIIEDTPGKFPNGIVSPL